jgi:hypothetical protein
VADDKQGTLGGLPGEFRCCDHETSIVLIILLQHDAERSSRDIGKIGTTRGEQLIELREVSRPQPGYRPQRRSLSRVPSLRENPD